MTISNPRPFGARTGAPDDKRSRCRVGAFFVSNIRTHSAYIPRSSFFLGFMLIRVPHRLEILDCVDHDGPQKMQTVSECPSPVDCLSEHDRCSSPTNLSPIRPNYSIGMVAFAPIREVLICRPKTNGFTFDWRSKLISSQSFSGTERGPAVIETPRLKRKKFPIRTTESGSRFEASKRKASKKGAKACD